MEKNSVVALPEAAKKRVAQLQNEIALANMKLQAYAQGCIDALGLEGDWNLDTSQWVFTKIVKPEPVKEE